jgi:hypothetical protein
MIHHHSERTTYRNASNLLKSVVADANNILMLPLQVRIWAGNSSVAVSQWDAQNMGIRQDQGGLKIQWRVNKVWERI